MTKAVSNAGRRQVTRSSSHFESVHLPLILIYEYRLRDAHAVERFLAACAEYAVELAYQEPEQAISWLYGVDPTKEDTVRCIQALWSLSSHSMVIKSRAWKQFLKNIRGLDVGRKTWLAEEMRGGVSLHHQLRRAA